MLLRLSYFHPKSILAKDALLQYLALIHQPLINCLSKGVAKQNVVAVVIVVDHYTMSRQKLYVRLSVHIFVQQKTLRIIAQKIQDVHIIMNWSGPMS